MSTTLDHTDVDLLSEILRREEASLSVIAQNWKPGIAEQERRIERLRVIRDFLAAAVGGYLIPTEEE